VAQGKYTQPIPNGTNSDGEPLPGEKLPATIQVYIRLSPPDFAFNSAWPLGLRVELPLSYSRVTGENSLLFNKIDHTPQPPPLSRYFLRVCCSPWITLSLLIEWTMSHAVTKESDHELFALPWPDG
jgi:hypothetical protein